MLRALACCSNHSTSKLRVLSSLPATATSSEPSAVDASDDSFRFYSGGVYHNPDCATKPADLDHAVIIRWAAGCGIPARRMTGNQQCTS